MSCAQFSLFGHPRKIVYVDLADSAATMMRHIHAWKRAKDAGIAYASNPHNANVARARARYRRHLRAAIERV